MTFRPRHRLWFLVGVNALILFHICAYYLHGQHSIGCVDFFGLATFLGKGQITSGTIFLGSLILVTLIAGRVFCGWGCHFALFQDLLTKLFVRIGIRTPFRRSRLEYVLPPIMFVVTLLYPIAAWWRDSGVPQHVSADFAYPEVSPGHACQVRPNATLVARGSQFALRTPCLEEAAQSDQDWNFIDRPRAWSSSTLQSRDSC